jgi:3-keto-disaccharide hydrolase
LIRPHAALCRETFTMLARWNRIAAAVLFLIVVAVCGRTALQADDKKPTEKKIESKPKLKEIKLFNGKDLTGWKSSAFGGDGEISIEEEKLILDFGNDLTGVTWKDGKTLPKVNYEISLEAMRVEGSDFFCGLTFPIKDDPCSLIIGGWGGSVCGLSSLDYRDASENETTSYREFKNNQWYKLRLRVLEKKITAWIDDKQLLDADITGKKITIRGEVEASKPLGFCTWRTKGALRNMVLKEIEPPKAE